MYYKLTNLLKYNKKPEIQAHKEQLKYFQLPEVRNQHVKRITTLWLLEESFLPVSVQTQLADLFKSLDWPKARNREGWLVENCYLGQNLLCTNNCVDCFDVWLQN